jgi:DNA-binding NarL/FixJ family response regulator
MNAAPALTVQIAEDSPGIRDLLLAHLGQVPGVQVTAASPTATETLERLRDSPPGLLVLDLQLDSGSAFDVLKGLPPDAPRPRVVILTNHSGPEMRAACAAMGADYFFDKTGEFGSFLETVRTLAGAAAAGGA